jgi:hypothetical protein
LFWDAQEKDCPPVLHERFLEASRQAGGTNVTAHVSQTTDAHRWLHGYRNQVRDLHAADDLFLPDVFTRRPPAKLSARGELEVAGYVVTNEMEVWLGDGLSGHERVRYSLDADQPKASVIGESKSALRVAANPSILRWTR